MVVGERNYTYKRSISMELIHKDDRGPGSGQSFGQLSDSLLTMSSSRLLVSALHSGDRGGGLRFFSVCTATSIIGELGAAELTNC